MDKKFVNLYITATGKLVTGINQYSSEKEALDHNNPPYPGSRHLDVTEVRILNERDYEKFEKSKSARRV